MITRLVKPLIAFLLLSIPAMAGQGGFLFVTFKNETTPLKEQMYFGLSQDGQNWTALNDSKPVLVSHLGTKGTRDPFILRSHDGSRFYVIATDLSIYYNGNWTTAVQAGSHSIVVWESCDLVNWSPPRLVAVSASDAGCTWAPEAVYDDSTGDYLVFWASTSGSDSYAKQRIWASRTQDFKTFGTPFIYVEKAVSVIDADIIKDGAKYYRFTKDETYSAIAMETSDQLTGTWTNVSGFSLATVQGYEGPECYQLASGMWCLIADHYTAGTGYTPFVTSSLASGAFTAAAGFNFPFPFRHGSVLPLTADEYVRLSSTYQSSARILAHLPFNETSGTSAADAAGHAWNGTLVNGPLHVAGKGGNGVSLDGTNDYVSLPTGTVFSLTDFTVSAWVNINSLAQWSRVFDFGTGTNSYMFLTPKAGSGFVRFAMTTSGYGSEQGINGTAALPTGVWTHVAVSVSGSLGILYVNGVEVGRNASMTLNPSLLGVTNQNWLGRSQFSGDPYLNGSIDDFRIYSAGLPAASVQALSSGSAGALSSPWSDQDLGVSSLAGSSGTGDDYMALAASGTGIQGTADQGHFTYQPWTGDGVLTTCLNTVSGNDSSAANAGIMFREDLTDSARCLYLGMTRSGSLTWQYRDSTGGTTTTATTTSTTPAAPWLRITRHGDVFTAFVSVDGTTYSQVGSPVTLTLPQTLDIGPVMSSGSNAALETARFSNVSIANPALAAPAGFTAAASGTSIDLSWNSVPGAAGYNIRRAPASGGPYAVIATGLASNTYIDTTLAGGTTYYYVVSAVNSDGESVNSAEIRVTLGGRPALGWNSWDFYGVSINEERTKAQADYMAANLLSHGWNLITVDHQWYQPTATGFTYIDGATLTMDSYGRLTPATNKFPSASGGLGFKPLADYAHSKGLTFGIHILRGIPRQAVAQNTPVLGTSYTANQIADTTSPCVWCTDMYGVDMTKPGAQAYYDSVMALVASWGVDFVKIDDLSKPYHTAEIEAIRKAIDKTGRAIVLSTSPGATPVSEGPRVMQQANQWRISDDFWDNWTALYEQFLRLHNWEPFRSAGHFPDADMLPLGMVSGGSNTATGRSTNFTTDEQYTLMSLWAIARSPLIHGGDMTQMDAATLALLTNDEVLVVNQQSFHNRQLFRTNDLIAWTADAEGSSDKYLAVFNATSSSASVPVTLSTMGFGGTCTIRSLWDQTDLGTFSGIFSPTLASHRGALYRISGTSVPVPWISSIVSGGNRVALSWEAISSASSYSVKRATSETGTYTTIASGLSGTSYTDLTAQNGTTYYYAVSAVISGQETLNSAPFSALPTAAQGIISWNYDRYGTVSGSSVAGVAPVANWNNTDPDNPVTNLADHLGGTTTLDIAYSYHNQWSIQSSHPGADANGTYNREMLNGYLDSGGSNTPVTSSVTISQIPFNSYDLYVYFGSDVANRTGTVTDGSTTFSFKTVGSASISGSNAVLTQTTDTASGNPSANYAVFTALSGSTKTVSCNIPNNGGIAAFQIVPRVDALTITSASPLAVGTVGAAYSQTLSGTGGNAPYTWSLGAGTLPTGLGLSGTGLLGGTPSAPGTFVFTAQITDSAALTATGQFSVTVSPLAAPTGLAATAGNAQAALSWTPSTGTSSYNVKRSLVSGSNYSTISSGTATSHTDTGLTDGTTYYYVVSAVNAGGESVNSSEASATTPLSSLQSWRLANFGTVDNSGKAADNADPDGDGWTNAQEFAAGTDPNNRASVLKISQTLAGGNDMLVSFPTVAGKIYRLEYSGTLQSGSWNTVRANGVPQDNINGTGSTVQITDTGGAAQPKRFYRIAVQ
jgi:alpha-galactosidase